MDSPDTTPPWMALAPSFDHKIPVPGMIEPVERLMLYWAAKEFWRGFGEIVEIGCFAGLSTTALARGIQDNGAVKTKRKRLHSYDLFQIPDYNTEYYCKLLGLPSEYRGSFQHVFERNIADYHETVAIYPGDVVAREWQGRPIEVMFLDCSETEELFDHVFRSFFRALIPGQSLVILQDFFYYRTYFLPHFVLRFAKQFELVGTAGSSLVLRHIEPFPDEAFGKATLGTETEMRRSLQTAIKAFGDTGSELGGRLSATFAFLEWKCGNHQEVMRILKHLNEVNPSPIVKQDVVNVLKLLKSGN
jgi:hypothetical protein